MQYRNICEIYFTFQSGRQDSNLRPPGPKPGAMTGLRYAPKNFYFDAERLGLEPRHRLPDDRLAICSVTTPAPLLYYYERLCFRFASANIECYFFLCK